MACMSRLAQVQVVSSPLPLPPSRRSACHPPLLFHPTAQVPILPCTVVPLAPREHRDRPTQARARGGARRAGPPSACQSRTSGGRKGREEGGREDDAGRGVPRRAAGAGSGGGRDVAGGGARLLRRRHHRALLRGVPPPLQACRGVLAAARCPLPPPRPLGTEVLELMPLLF